MDKRTKELAEKEKPKPIRIIIADDHEIVANGLSACFKDDPEFEVIKHCSNGKEVLEVLKKQDLDIILMDVRMPKMDGISAASNINIIFPQVKIIMLTIHNTENEMFRSVDAGAKGYLLKDSNLSTIKEAIREVHHGGTYFFDELGKAYYEAKCKGIPYYNGKYNNPFGLTDKEIQIIQFISEGLTSKQISKILGIKADSIRVHRKKIYSKMDVSSSVELIIKSIESGIIKVGE